MVLLELSPQLTVKLYDPSLRSGRATLFASELPLDVFLVSQVLMKSVVAACAALAVTKPAAQTRKRTTIEETNFFITL